MRNTLVEMVEMVVLLRLDLVVVEDLERLEETNPLPIMVETEELERAIQ